MSKISNLQKEYDRESKKTIKSLEDVKKLKILRDKILKLMKVK